ncbi:hypothetical protein [Virgisporangium aurantiacum]|uniref:Uncharacterized protein n=1 Tax=Virgisporangium aurantiacum TaxID=175570 RepID=A0A8J3ZIS5_9ACTN|nr:hypothetical protein [Virgisporangium aurantiacum]GIJ64576.1 hypothetical protein Vau01_120920 [Virgisporangium aurantiacum]
MSSTTAAVGHVPTPMPPSKTTATRDRAGGDRGPFPVTIVRPALVTLPPLTAVQRDRRRAARKLAADLTERALRRRWRPVYHPVDLHLCVDRDGEAIIRDAPDIAAAPPGAVQVGRDRRGRALAVVLHAEDWSLVIDAFAINTYGWQPPMTWVFLDRPDLRQKGATRT